MDMAVFSSASSDPAGGSVAVEMQTTSNCSVSTNWGSSYNVVTDLTGRAQTIQLPFDGFDNNPNADSIVGFSWAEFTGNGAWTIANISLVCGSITPPPGWKLPSRTVRM